MSDGPVYRVMLLPHRLQFDARGDESLLKAGLRAMAPVRSSCRNGTCRTCICRLAGGSVRYLVEWPGLSIDEKREGYILPCVAVARDDLVVDQRLAKRIVFPD